MQSGGHHPQASVVVVVASQETERGNRPEEQVVSSTLRDPFGLARWRRLSSMSNASANGNRDNGTDDPTRVDAAAVNHDYHSELQEQWDLMYREQQEGAEGEGSVDALLCFAQQVQEENGRARPEYGYDRAMALSKMNKIMQSRRIQKRAAMYSKTTANKELQQQQRHLPLTLETLTEVDNETDANITPASSNYSSQAHTSSTLSRSLPSLSSSSSFVTRRDNEHKNKDKNHHDPNFQMLTKSNAAALVTPDSAATSVTASTNDSLWQSSSISPGPEVTPPDRMQPAVPTKSLENNRNSSTSLRLTDCDIRAELARIQRELKDSSRFSASSLWTSRRDAEEVATIVTMDSSVTNLLDDSVLNALHPDAVHDIQEAGRTHWDDALKGARLEEEEEKEPRDGHDESMVSVGANEISSNVWEDDASSVGDLRSVATRGTVIGEEAKDTIRARKALLREIVVCGGPHNLCHVDKGGAEREKDNATASPAATKPETPMQPPPPRLTEAHNVSTVSALSPVSIASSSATRPLRTTLILTLTSNLPHNDVQQLEEEEEDGDDESKESAPSPSPTSPWIRKHEISKLQESTAPNETVLRPVTPEEYEAAPRVVKMQVSLEDVSVATECLNDWFQRSTDDSLEESRACAILREHSHFGNHDECKSVLLSLCHWKRLAMCTTPDGPRYFQVT